MVVVKVELRGGVDGRGSGGGEGGLVPDEVEDAAGVVFGLVDEQEGAIAGPVGGFEVGGGEVGDAAIGGGDVDSFENAEKGGCGGTGCKWLELDI